MTSCDLPDFLRDMINSPPRAGEGVHPWLFRVARQLHAHLPAVEIVALLETRAAHCGRHVPRAEVVAAVQNSIGCAWQPNGRHAAPSAPRRWPAVNAQARREIIAEGEGLADLWEASPVRMDSNAPLSEEFIDALFPGNPLLCVGKYAKKSDGESYTAFDTRPRETWRGSLSGLELVVPSPMTARTGLTKEGKESAHTLDNTGPRRFLVIEQDNGTEDEQSAILLHLASRAPLALAVHSGGKSLHGWFFCAGQPEDRLESFFRYAVSLGADPATWTRSQFVRVPDGTRDNDKRQTVFFFNPQVIKT